MDETDNNKQGTKKDGKSRFHKALIFALTYDELFCHTVICIVTVIVPPLPLPLPALHHATFALFFHYSLATSI